MGFGNSVRLAAESTVVSTLVNRQLATMMDESGMYLQDLAEKTGIPADLLAGIKVGFFKPNQAQVLALVRALASPDEVRDGRFVSPARDRRKQAVKRLQGNRDYREGPPTGNPLDVGAPDPLLVQDIEQLVPALREVHLWAGKPSLRDLAGRHPDLTRSSVGDMLNGRVPIPPYKRYRAFLEACGIQELEPWTYTWCRLSKLQSLQDR
ncbi:helix-turn-helix domain-containing protein [Streptomyces collinus]|uniref:helix-turn-helix domain-containing protein n=1 Tax=Streptomyces collinus TaxID=42684 RepID=UPI0033F68384